MAKVILGLTCMVLLSQVQGKGGGGEGAFSCFGLNDPLTGCSASLFTSVKVVCAVSCNVDVITQPCMYTS